MEQYEENRTDGEAAAAGDGPPGGELWDLLDSAVPGLVETIRAGFEEAVASNPALAAWPLWVETILLLTPAEAAEHIGVSLSLIYQLCTEKRLPHYRIGGDGRRGKLLIDEADLAAFLAACRVAADGVDETEPLRHIR